jgi:DNA-directed RNA polymerase subunit RPC12/RpoP
MAATFDTISGMNRRELACPTCNQKYLMESRPGHEELVGVFPFFCDCATQIEVNTTLPIVIYKMDSKGDWDFADTMGPTV